MNTGQCHCAEHTTRPSVSERPRYYSRQLITPDDMTLEQDYFRTKLRRHNRFLHGWGVVCGAEVVEANKPWRVIVKTGYILGPYGDEIYIEKDFCLDVRKSCTQSPPLADDDCVEVQPPEPSDAPRFIAVRYVEKPTHLVRVPLGGCGCEENTCEYTRFSDSYEICVLDHCPDSHHLQNGEPRDVANLGITPACPECPTDPWVVLGEFTVDEQGKVTLEEPSNCRKQLEMPIRYGWTGYEMKRNADDVTVPEVRATETIKVPTQAKASDKTAATVDLTPESVSEKRK